MTFFFKYLRFKKCLIFSLVFSLLSLASQAQLKGTYTIDSSKAASSTNYKNFTSAVGDLVNGKRTDGGTANGPYIKSSVVFNVSDGIYYEKLQITQISGVNPATILFQSASGDSSKVILIDTNSTTAVDNYTLYLNGADFVIFKGMTIQRGGSGNYANVIQIDNNANGNQFLNNQILSKRFTGFTYPYPSLIYSLGSFPYSNDSGNAFRNNFMKYGFYSFSWYSSNASPENATVIDGNIMDSNYNGGIYMQYQSDFVISNNIIRNIINPYGLGIYSYYSYGKNKVWGNKIIMPKGGEALSLQYNQAGSTDTTLVVNNFISVGGAAYAGIYIYSGDYITVSNNNVLLYGSSPYASYCASFTSTYFSGSHFILLNNNLINYQLGSATYAVYSSGSALAISDFNNLYTRGSTLGYLNSSTFSNLANWHTSTSFDSNSLSLSPGFVSNTDLHITNVYLNGKAQPSARVLTDIDGQFRDPKIPDIGADEFFPVNNDAGLTSIDSPAVGCSGTKNIYVTLRNYGKFALSSVQINWQVGTGLIKGIKFSGTLGVGKDTFIKVGSYTFFFPGAGSKIKIKAWTSSPNGVLDSNSGNDTFSIISRHGMSGTYYIGGTGATFSTFRQVANALQANGVCGAATFNIRDGVYNEQVEFAPIAGASVSSQILFRSQSGDSTKVILTFPATNNYSYNNNYTLSLNGADWLVFNKITISRFGLGYYGNVIQIQGGATNNVFFNNLFLGSVIPGISYTYYNTSNIVFSGGDNDNNNLFKRNYIKGGYYNCNYKGSSQTSSESGTIFDENTFDSSYFGAFNLQYEAAPLLKNNLIQNILGGFSYGISLYYVNGNARIIANRIQMFGGGIGLYIGYGTKGVFSSRILVANNFITLADASGYADAGVQVDNSDSIDIVYNNISVIDPSTVAAALYINSINNSVRVYNNSITNSGGGYAMYVLSGALQASDRNNLYVKKGILGYYSGSSAINFYDWQAVTSLDSNSLNVDPLYYSALNLHVRNSNLDGKAKPFSGINYDIDGQYRNPIHPDIGADEIFPFKNDAGIASVDSPAAGFCGGVQNVYARIRNYGTDTIRTLTIHWSLNGIVQSNVSFKGNLAKGDEILCKLGAVYFLSKAASKLIVSSSNPNGKNDSQPSNDTAIRVLNTGLNGTYIIGGKSDDYSTISSAANDLALRGLCGAVIFNIRNGIYKEQVEITSAVGASKTNFITFQSLSGDSSAAILQYNSSFNLTNNYTLRLNGVHFVTIKGLTISRYGMGIGSTVIEVTGQSSDNSILNNRIIGIKVPALNATDYFNTSVLIYSPSANDNRNQFVNNYLNGNFWAFYYSGTGIPDPEKSTLISGNTIDSSYSGMFLQYQDSLTITKNRIQNLRGSYFAIQAYYAQNSPKITRNRIYLPNGGYGIYSYYLHGTSVNSALVVNNVISVKKYGSGISCSYSDNVGFYYNTVVSKTSNTYFTGYFQGNIQNNVSLFNNIFSNDSTGGAISGGKTIITSANNNDYFTKGKIIGNWDGTATNILSDWQKASSLDAKSLSVKPGFKDTVIYDINNTSPLIHKAIPIALVKRDITGLIRNVTLPDIGAHEANPMDTDLALESIEVPQSGSCGDSFMYLVVKVKNMGLKPQTYFSVYANIAGAAKTKLAFAFSSDTLKAGVDTLITFPVPFNTYKGGKLKIQAYTSIANDHKNTNDTIGISVDINSRLRSPFARNGNTCGPGSVKLIAFSKDSTLWYDSVGNYLQSGDTLLIPYLYKTRRYYTQSISSIRKAGLYSPDSAGGYNPSADFNKGLQFDALNDFTLDSLTVYPQESGTIFINVRDSNGAIIKRIKSELTISTSFAPVRLYINAKIPIGRKYSMDAIGSSIGSLYANGVNSIGTATFPYIVPNLLAITDNDDNSGKYGRYYYFYNWKIRKGFSCESPLTPVYAVVGTGTKPIANFTTSISCNGTASFTDSSSSSGTPLSGYTYEFGDSATYSNTFSTTSVTHYYPQHGIYRALLTVFTSGGCSDSISKLVKVFPALRAAFYVKNTCLSDSVHFYDSSASVAPYLTYKWAFGDGGISTLKNPVHLYQNNGNYRVRLLVTSPLCSDTVSYVVRIYPTPVPAFTYKGNCLGDTTYFKDNSVSQDSITNYIWNINSVIDSLKNPSVRFTSIGKYSFGLNIMTNKGCKANTSGQISIHPKPNPHFSFTDSLNIFSFTASDTNLKSYTWNFGDSNYFYKNHRAVHVYLHQKDYIVTLNVTDSNACANSFDSLINVSMQGIENISQDAFNYSLYPNPFVHSTNLFYHLMQTEKVSIEICDMTGKSLSKTSLGVQSPGVHSIAINPILSPGIYLLKLKVGENMFNLSMIKL